MSRSVRFALNAELDEEAIQALVNAVNNANTADLGVLAGNDAAVTIVPPVAVAASPIELPEDWRLVEEREHETYSWPEGPDEYETFRVYEGTTSKGSIRLALGFCDRVEVRGKDRQYVITHYIGAGGSPRPIAEFLEVDDYEQTRELIAVIKGKGDSPKMYDPTDDLPDAYDGLRIETYRDRIDWPGSYTKQAVVAHEDDAATMLAHTLIQAQSRHGLGPS